MKNGLAYAFYMLVLLVYQYSSVYHLWPFRQTMRSHVYRPLLFIVIPLGFCVRSFILKNGQGGQYIGITLCAVLMLGIGWVIAYIRLKREDRWDKLYEWPW